MTKSRNIRRRFDASRIEAIREAYENSTKPIRRIAEDLGCTRAKIRDLAATHGWKPRGSGFHLKANPKAAQPNKSPRKMLFRQAGKAVDAREHSYSPEVLRAIKTLQRHDFAVFRRGEGFMCGTKILSEDALMEKAARYA